MLNKKHKTSENIRRAFYENGHVLETAIDKISDFRGEIVENLGFAPIFVVQQKTERFMPRINLFDNEKAYLVSIELPGIAADELSLVLTADWLRITGKRSADSGEARILFLEQLDGKFSRKLHFEAPVQGDAGNAVLDKGVLKVTVPKAEQETTRADEFIIVIKE